MSHPPFPWLAYYKKNVQPLYTFVVFFARRGIHHPSSSMDAGHESSVYHEALFLSRPDSIIPCIAYVLNNIINGRFFSTLDFLYDLESNFANMGKSDSFSLNEPYVKDRVLVHEPICS
ncbi:hypothetical protein AMTRI_Chr04g252470 [Amborella trichopoda]